MKTLIIFCITVLLTASVKAQGVIELNETKVEARSLFDQMEQNGNQFSLKIGEQFQGEFQKDPIAFAEKNLNMAQFASFVDPEFESFFVNFKTRKGILQGHYDRKGELLASSYRFKNIALPNAVSHQVFRDNMGWKLTKTILIGHKRGDREETSYYKVTLKNGKQKKNLKYPVLPVERDRVASTF